MNALTPTALSAAPRVDFQVPKTSVILFELVYENT